MVFSNKNDKIFSLCLRDAEKSELLHQHGCIAVKGGKIIARGCNTYKNYSSRDMFLNCSCSCHAEINVLRQIYHAHKRKERKLHKIMKKTTLYVSRISRSEEDDGYKSNNSAPCMSCTRFIKQFNIKRVVYNLNNEHYVENVSDYAATSTSLGDKTLIDMGVYTPTYFQ